MTLTDVETGRLMWSSRITTPASQDITEQVTQLVEVGGNLHSRRDISEWVQGVREEVWLGQRDALAFFGSLNLSDFVVD